MSYVCLTGSTGAQQTLSTINWSLIGICKEWELSRDKRHPAEKNKNIFLSLKYSMCKYVCFCVCTYVYPYTCMETQGLSCIAEHPQEAQQCPGGCHPLVAFCTQMPHSQRAALKVKVRKSAQECQQICAHTNTHIVTFFSASVETLRSSSFSLKKVELQGLFMRVA